MSKIQLHWFKHKQGGNFGDELGWYIIQKLSGKKVRYVPIAASRSRRIVRGFRQFLRGGLSVYDLWLIALSVVHGNYIISVGSLLGWCSSMDAIVWGAGILNNKDVIQNSDFRAVRGKETQKRLDELGFKVPHAIGDPALLLPLIFKPTVEKDFQLGIIPHYRHYKKCLESISDSRIKIINLLNPPETVIEEINMCSKTISTSLHGLIVSHVYMIDSLWYSIGSDPIGGDDIKFYDYFSSVNISPYKPFFLDLTNPPSMSALLKNIESNSILASIDTNLLLIQKSLIQSAPFQVLQKFKEFTS